MNKHPYPKLRAILRSLSIAVALGIMTTACSPGTDRADASASGWTVVKRSSAQAARVGNRCVVEIGLFRGPDGKVKLSAFRGPNIGGFTIDWGVPVDFRGIPFIVALTIGEVKFPANIDYSERPSATAMHVINTNGFWISRYMQGASTIRIDSKGFGRPLTFDSGDLTEAGIALDQCGQQLYAETKSEMARQREKVMSDIWGEDKSKRPPFAQ